MSEFRDPLTHQILGAAIEVHREFGPAVLESAYEQSFSFELAQRGLSFQRQVILPLIYKGQQINAGYRLDLIVEGLVIVEIKCVEKLLSVHDAQVLTYLKLSGIETGLLINFHSQPLMKGVKRLVRTRSAVTVVSAVPNGKGNAET